MTETLSDTNLLLEFGLLTNLRRAYFASLGLSLAPIRYPSRSTFLTDAPPDLLVVFADAPLHAFNPMMAERVDIVVISMMELLKDFVSEQLAELSIRHVLSPTSI